jgi:hypothetical protein
MQSSWLPCYVAPLRPKYLPQHPIFEHPQPMLLPQCERPNFTPIQYNWQNYSFAYFNIYISGLQTGRQKILLEWFTEFSLILISSWIQFWRVRVVPKC